MLAFIINIKIFNNFCSLHIGTAFSKGKFQIFWFFPILCLDHLTFNWYEMIVNLIFAYNHTLNEKCIGIWMWSIPKCKCEIYSFSFLLPSPIYLNSLLIIWISLIWVIQFNKCWWVFTVCIASWQMQQGINCD